MRRLEVVDDLDLGSELRQVLQDRGFPIDLVPDGIRGFDFAAAEGSSSIESFPVTTVSTCPGDSSGPEKTFHNAAVPQGDRGRGAACS
jgi:hypothetical protein